VIWLGVLGGAMLGVGSTFLAIRVLGLHVCPEDPEHPPRVEELSEEDRDLRNEF
jgi:hypothetical protein